MPTSRLHKLYVWVLGMLATMAAEESNRSLQAAGQMTFERPDLDRALQPDGCFWVQSAARMQGVLAPDFRRDPPPDLVLDIDITASSLPRLPIYAALGVREVWRFDGAVLQVGLLTNGQYSWSAAAKPFHFCPSATPADSCGKLRTPTAFSSCERCEHGCAARFHRAARIEHDPREAGLPRGPPPSCDTRLVVPPHRASTEAPPSGDTWLTVHPHRATPVAPPSGGSCAARLTPESA